MLSLDDIAVGIVFHGTGTMPALGSPSRIEVLTQVNASHSQRTPWRGFGANHNLLMAQTSARWYIAVNPDVSIEARDLVQLVAIAEDAGLAVAGPAIASPWGVARSGKQGFPSARVWIEEAVGGARRRERPPRARDVVEESDWLTGACLAIRRDLGLRFDERYFMYFEDAELCRHAWQSGLRVGVCPSVTAVHASGWSSRDPLLRRRGVEFARSAVRFAQRAGVSPRSMTLAGIVRYGSRVPYRARSPQGAAARSITRGFMDPSRPGLAELAAEFNAGQGSRAPAGAGVVVG